MRELSALEYKVLVCKRSKTGAIHIAELSAPRTSCLLGSVGSGKAEIKQMPGVHVCISIAEGFAGLL